MHNPKGKYLPYAPFEFEGRTWPNQTISDAPVWCSVDLRDGNQALIEPMNLDEKLLFFKTLTDIGFKEIEIGFPAASETEYEILRTLIEKHLIPDDVWVQVLVQARPHLIEKTFEAIKGAKNVIVHFYNSTSTLQRKVVFHKDKAGITDLAVSGARLIKKLTEGREDKSSNIRFEYSPESFSGTEPDFAAEICDQVLETLGATPDNKVIINLPNTVEGTTPNFYADMIEYFCKQLKRRDSAIISVHPHNDRGTGVAASELALMAGAERLEGTLFGNGERTGNADIITVAMNMYAQGIAPGLELSNIPEIRRIYESATRMKVHERHPYSGDLVFTAFSGSHQDAIRKGKEHMKKSGTPLWEVPYLPIDPADIGREYDPVIRINSQSGKGGAAFVMEEQFGYFLPKDMHPEFGRIVQKACDKTSVELKPNEIFELFELEYLKLHYPYNLKSYKLTEQPDNQVRFDGVIRFRHNDTPISGAGNGPIDAFFNALKPIGIDHFQFVTYSEHALSSGADSKAVAYIKLCDPENKIFYGVGEDHNIIMASIKGVICAINRSIKSKKEHTQ